MVKMLLIRTLIALLLKQLLFIFMTKFIRSSLLSVFNTNLGYAGCATPLMEMSPGRYQPAIKSRLFWEDIPYGLCILKNMAELLGNFPTPRLDFMIRWHQQVIGTYNYHYF